jgi:curved DNA-binding protein CbpA
MNNQTLYELLGVKPDATVAQIRKGHRDASKACHPDAHPGDVAAAERFKEVQYAFEVLSDPLRRKRYDATGRIGRELDHPDHDAMEMIGSMLGSLIQELVDGQGDPARVCIVAALKKMLKLRGAELEKGRKELVRKKERLEYLAKRFTVDQGKQNVLGSMISGPVKRIPEALADLDRQLATIERATAIVAEHRFKVAERGPSMTSVFTTTGGGFSGFTMGG